MVVVFVKMQIYILVLSSSIIELTTSEVLDFPVQDSAFN